MCGLIILNHKRSNRLLAQLKNRQVYPALSHNEGTMQGTSMDPGYHRLSP